MTVGETHSPIITFTDADGNLYQPDVVTLTVADPLGNVTTPTIVNTSTGVYMGTFILLLPGVWRFEFYGEGPGDSIVIEGSGVCAESNITA